MVFQLLQSDARLAKQFLTLFRHSIYATLLIFSSLSLQYRYHLATIQAISYCIATRLHILYYLQLPTYNIIQQSDLNLYTQQPTLHIKLIGLNKSCPTIDSYSKVTLPRICILSQISYSRPAFITTITGYTCYYMSPIPQTYKDLIPAPEYPPFPHFFKPQFPLQNKAVTHDLPTYIQPQAQLLSTYIKATLQLTIQSPYHCQSTYNSLERPPIP